MSNLQIPEFKVNVVYGSVKLDSRFTADGTGQYRKRTYDEDGRLKEDTNWCNSGINIIWT